MAMDYYDSMTQTNADVATEFVTKPTDHVDGYKAMLSGEESSGSSFLNGRSDCAADKRASYGDKEREVRLPVGTDGISRRADDDVEERWTEAGAPVPLRTVSVVGTTGVTAKGDDYLVEGTRTASKDGGGDGSLRSAARGANVASLEASSAATEVWRRGWLVRGNDVGDVRNVPEKSSQPGTDNLPSGSGLGSSSIPRLGSHGDGGNERRLNGGTQGRPVVGYPAVSRPSPTASSLPGARHVSSSLPGGGRDGAQVRWRRHQHPHQQQQQQHHYQQMPHQLETGSQTPYGSERHGGENVQHQSNATSAITASAPPRLERAALSGSGVRTRLQRSFSSASTAAELFKKEKAGMSLAGRESLEADMAAAATVKTVNGKSVHRRRERGAAIVGGNTHVASDIHYPDFSRDCSLTNGSSSMMKGSGLGSGSGSSEEKKRLKKGSVGEVSPVSAEGVVSSFSSPALNTRESVSGQCWVADTVPMRNYLCDAVGRGGGRGVKREVEETEWRERRCEEGGDGGGSSDASVIGTDEKSRSAVRSDPRVVLDTDNLSCSTAMATTASTNSSARRKLTFSSLNIDEVSPTLNLELHARSHSSLTTAHPSGAAEWIANNGKTEVEAGGGGGGDDDDGCLVRDGHHNNVCSQRITKRKNDYLELDAVLRPEREIVNGGVSADGHGSRGQRIDGKSDESVGEVDEYFEASDGGYEEAYGLLTEDGDDPHSRLVVGTGSPQDQAGTEGVSPRSEAEVEGRIGSRLSFVSTQITADDEGSQARINGRRHDTVADGAGINGSSSSMLGWNGHGQPPRHPPREDCIFRGLDLDRDIDSSDCASPNDGRMELSGGDTWEETEGRVSVAEDGQERDARPSLPYDPNLTIICDVNTVADQSVDLTRLGSSGRRATWGDDVAEPSRADTRDSFQDRNGDKGDDGLDGRRSLESTERDSGEVAFAMPSGLPLPPHVDVASYLLGERAALERALHTCLPRRDQITVLHANLTSLKTASQQDACRIRQLENAGSGFRSSVSGISDRLQVLEGRLPPLESSLAEVRGGVTAYMGVIARLSQLQERLASLEASQHQSMDALRLRKQRDEDNWMSNFLYRIGRRLVSHLSKVDVASVLLAQKILLDVDVQTGDGKPDSLPVTMTRNRCEGLESEEEASTSSTGVKIDVESFSMTVRFVSALLTMTRMPMKKQRSMMGAVLLVAAMEMGWRVQRAIRAPLPRLLRTMTSPVDYGMRVVRICVWVSAFVVGTAEVKRLCYGVADAIARAQQVQRSRQQQKQASPWSALNYKATGDDRTWWPAGRTRGPSSGGASVPKMPKVIAMSATEPDVSLPQTPRPFTLPPHGDQRQEFDIEAGQFVRMDRMDLE